MAPGSCRNSACAFGDVRHYSLVAKVQGRAASVRYRGCLPSLVLFSHAIRVQDIRTFPLWPRPPSNTINRHLADYPIGDYGKIGLFPEADKSAGRFIPALPQGRYP